MSTPLYIVAAARKIDQIGDLQHVQQSQQALQEAGARIETLVIDPLKAGWQTQVRPGHFRSGCAPLDALAEAQRRLQADLADAIVIDGEDLLRTGYTRTQRHQLMAIYGDISIPEAYTLLAKHFCRLNDLAPCEFFALRNLLLNNYQRTYQALHADFNPNTQEAWLKPVTEWFRGVDCANPNIDFSGRLLLTRADWLGALAPLSQRPIRLAGVGIGLAPDDGPDHVAELAEYWHLQKAVHYANLQAEVDFVELFQQAQAYLEVYTCYPVVPLAFLMRTGLADSLQALADLLQHQEITITGGMNLARAPWNNPAFNALIAGYQKLQDEQARPWAGIHANGGLGYRQGFALLHRDSL